MNNPFIQLKQNKILEFNNSYILYKVIIIMILEQKSFISSKKLPWIAYER